VDLRLVGQADVGNQRTLQPAGSRARQQQGASEGT
jgi:hypothetical protein